MADRILLLCECLLLLRGVSIFLLTQDDVAIRNYIVLTQLVPDLQQMVDEKKIAFTPAVELSYLKPDEQRMLIDTIESEQSTPSLSQAQRMKKLSQSGALNDDVMLSIMTELKKHEKNEIRLSSDILEKYI